MMIAMSLLLMVFCLSMKEAIRVQLFGTQRINKEGMLTIGGIDAKTLKERYGTPLYVMDETHIRNQCRYFKDNFSHERVRATVIYASKAFLTIAMCQLIEEEGLALDVVSGGELHTAKKAGFPMEYVYFHGNNKSPAEIDMALALGVGTLIVDNDDELTRIIRAISAEEQIDIMLRINPGIEAHTHEYIATTKNDSKFGLSIFDAATLKTIRRINDHPNLVFRGFHSHIGSQIFDSDSFIKHADTILEYIKKVTETTGITVDKMNLGGGFGVRYVEQDAPDVGHTILKRLLDAVDEKTAALGIDAPEVLIEPGRAITANAGITLYEVGGTKRTFGGKTYVFTDGSMADHLRTALYQAEYQGVLANRMHDKAENTYTVTGKACESGDIIIRHCELPTPEKGDLLAVLSTGAYHYSMASNYNRLTRPAVLFVKDGTANVVVRRETYEDLIRLDVPLR